MKNIEEFEEGITVVGGFTQYMVDKRKDSVSITICRRHYGLLTNNAVCNVRDYFKMPETAYKFISAMSTKKGLRLNFKKEYRNDGRLRCAEI